MQLQPKTRGVLALRIAPLALLLASGGAQAQFAGISSGYAGLNIGSSRFDIRCGTGGYGCDNSDVSVHAYAGGLVNGWAGLEAGYRHSGTSKSNGGKTWSQGVDLSAVLRAPIGAFNAFAKFGAIYGETRTSVGLLSNVAAGKKRGWGGTAGVGVGYDLPFGSTVVLEWERTQYPLPGSTRQHVDSTSLGYVYRF